MPGDTRPKELITLLKIAIEEGNDDLADEIRSDLYREYGLEMNKGGLASLPGYAPGGPVGSDLFGANMPSHRADPENYFKSIKKIGEVTKKKFLKKDGSIDIKKFNRFAIKQGADPLDKSPKGILRFTKWMNSYLPKGLKYEPVMIDKPGPGAGTKVFTAESTIRQQPGTVGAGLNKEIYDKGQKLNRTALKKFPNSKTARLKYIVDGLYKTFNRYEGVTKKFLKNFVKGRGFLSITPMGVATSLAMEMMEDPDYMNAVGFGESEPLTYKGGGMADIYDMTKPLGYRNGGETIPSKHQFSSNDMNVIKEMLKSEMLRQNSPDINTDKIAYQFMAEMNYKPTEENLKGIQDVIIMGMFNAQDELKQENTSDLGKLAGTVQDKYQTFMESDDKMKLIGSKLGLGSLWP